MIRKVQALTVAFFELSEGREELASQIMSNFMTQRAIVPFVHRTIKSPMEKFGSNAVSTVQAAKMGLRRSGTLRDMFRRSIIVSGASGPLCNDTVCWNFCGVFYSTNI